MHSTLTATCAQATLWWAILVVITSLQRNSAAFVRACEESKVELLEIVYVTDYWAILEVLVASLSTSGSA